MLFAVLDQALGPIECLILICKRKIYCKFYNVEKEKGEIMKHSFSERMMIIMTVRDNEDDDNDANNKSLTDGDGDDSDYDNSYL